MRIIHPALVMYKIEHYFHVGIKNADPTGAEYCTCKFSLASLMSAEKITERGKKFDQTIVHNKFTEMMTPNARVVIPPNLHCLLTTQHFRMVRHLLRKSLG